MTPKILKTPHEMIQWRKEHSASLGFVPTMGALHEGHQSLLKQARLENSLVVLSIFVNPTQFNDPNDLKKYPQTFEADLQMATDSGVDAIFYPNYDLMYPDQYRFKLIENDFSHQLCGRDRPGHFDGVLTVVMKLFSIVKPQKAYFGEKDFQQLTLIRQMVEAFFLDLQIVPMPTRREKDGLAMSSRNTRLTPEQRQLAPLIYQTISSASNANDAKQILNQHGFQVDYVEDHLNRRFVAAKLGEVRLIDNVELK